MTNRLPFEILTAILEQVDDIQDLRHARATGRTFCAIATPIAFRILSVTSTRGSAHNLGRLFDVPEIATHVREVAYCDAGADGRTLTPELNSIRTSAIPELASSFSRIHQLPQLETINLTLSPANGFISESLQVSILGALTDSFSIHAPSKLTSLYLKNLHTWDLTPLESSPFQTVLKNLRHLRLSVLFDRAENIISIDLWVDFWGTLFHRLFLAPTQHTLTELSLDSDSMTVGASAGLSFAGLHFPYLCTLSLRNIVFEPPVGVESFILRHAATLSRLELITCKLPIDEVSDSTHWEHVWDNFSAGLTALVALRVDESGSDSSDYHYVSPESAVLYWLQPVPEHRDVADDAALQRFYVTVAARSEERRNISSEVERGA